MRKSESITNLVRALVAAQADITGAELDATNPHYKSQYATLGSVQKACKEALKKNGLFVTQTADADGVENYLETTLMHTSGEWVQGRMRLIINQPDMQKLGSAWTYARRYSLAGLVGIVEAEDDDANFASQPAQQSRPSPAAAISAAIAMSGTAAGATVCPVGRNRGLRVDQLSLQELLGDVSYWRQREKNDGKPLSGNLANYVAAAEAYTRAQGSQSMTPTVTPKQQPAQPVLQNADTPPSWVLEGPDSSDIPF